MIRSFLRRWLQNAGGSPAVILVCAVLPMFLMALGAIDYAHVNTRTAAAQSNLDAAVLSTARNLVDFRDDHATDTTRIKLIQDQVTQFYKASCDGCTVIPVNSLTDLQAKAANLSYEADRTHYLWVDTKCSYLNATNKNTCDAFPRIQAVVKIPVKTFILNTFSSNRAAIRRYVNSAAKVVFEQGISLHILLDTSLSMGLPTDGDFPKRLGVSFDNSSTCYFACHEQVGTIVYPDPSSAGFGAAVVGFSSQDRKWDKARTDDAGPNNPLNYGQNSGSVDYCFGFTGNFIYNNHFVYWNADSSSPSSLYNGVSFCDDRNFKYVDESGKPLPIFNDVSMNKSTYKMYDNTSYAGEKYFQTMNEKQGAQYAGEGFYTINKEDTTPVKSANPLTFKVYTKNIHLARAIAGSDDTTSTGDDAIIVDHARKVISENLLASLVPNGSNDSLLNGMDVKFHLYIFKNPENNTTVDGFGTSQIWQKDQLNPAAPNPVHGGGQTDVVELKPLSGGLITDPAWMTSSEAEAQIDLMFYSNFNTAIPHFLKLAETNAIADSAANSKITYKRLAWFISDGDHHRAQEGTALQKGDDGNVVSYFNPTDSTYGCALAQTKGITLSTVRIDNNADLLFRQFLYRQTAHGHPNSLPFHGTQVYDWPLHKIRNQKYALTSGDNYIFQAVYGVCDDTNPDDMCASTKTPPYTTSAGTAPGQERKNWNKDGMTGFGWTNGSSERLWNESNKRADGSYIVNPGGPERHPSKTMRDCASAGGGTYAEAAASDNVTLGQSLDAQINKIKNEILSTARPRLIMYDPNK